MGCISTYTLSNGTTQRIRTPARAARPRKKS